MDETPKSDPADIGCFASVNELRLEHLNLMERHSALKDHGSEPEVRDISSFIARARATGSVLPEKDDRREAQGILDYWSSTLVSIGGADLRTWSQPRLANYDQAAKHGAKPVETEQTRAALSKLDDTARQLIRMSALARQWQNGGRYDGYLLVGDALEDARKFQGQDKDVDDLIRASDEHVIIKNQRRRLGVMTLISVLSAMVVALGWLVFDLHRKNVVLKNQTALVVKQSEKITDQREVIIGQSLQNSGIIDELKSSSDRARRTGGRSSPVNGPVIVLERLKPAATLPRNPANIAYHSSPDLRSFDTGTDEDRLSAALDFNRRLRSKGRLTGDQMALVNALVDLTAKDNMALLSPKGRHYLLFVLSLVPIQLWTKPEWQGINKELGQNLIDLQSAINAKQITLEPKSLQYLDAVQSYTKGVR